MTNQMIIRAILFLLSLLLIVPVPCGNCAEASTNNRPLLTRPLSLPDAIDLALQQNANVLKGRADLEAAYGLVLQTRAIVLPSVRSTGNFQAADPGLREQFPTPLPVNLPDNTWFVDIRVTQSLYEGGRMKSALREAKLTKEQAVSQFESVIADTVLDVQLAYYDALLAQQQILVQEASVNLLTNQLVNTRARFEAGTVRPFNVLRAEVELANAQPRLIRARNASRIAKNNLATLLGFDIPKDVWDDIPLNLSDKLEARPMSIELPSALGQALDRRPELMVLTKAERLRREQINDSRAGYKPSLRAYGGYQARNFSFSDDIAQEVHGWTTGLQLSWDLFDGLATQGRIKQATALHDRARAELTDARRRIEQEVRTAYSTFIEAREVLESQRKVVEQAEEALRQVTELNKAGAEGGTQLDVLSSQTALTDARTTQVQALRDYEAARARLERAIGQNVRKQKE
jgi:outer membrane protein